MEISLENLYVHIGAYRVNHVYEDTSLGFNFLLFS